MNCTCGKTAEYEMRSTQSPEYAFAVCKTHSADPEFEMGFTTSPITEEEKQQ